MRLLLVLLLLAALCAALASPGGILVMKSCSPTCPNSTVSSDGCALSVSCCQGSQCNHSAAAGLVGSPGTLWASIAASLLWALLWAAC
ncbi:lymphocyte antigen 6E-like [Trachypithecus francoisi]|uniref:lymphocyte antigen 6E-like n=1 Tax=Trachypithecus francoisi TaxID=54180 RepID=UPI00141B4D5B|nr:lymphocyte antigen 6E-like [Trachypithecus francoisi]